MHNNFNVKITRPLNLGQLKSINILLNTLYLNFKTTIMSNLLLSILFVLSILGTSQKALAVKNESNKPVYNGISYHDTVTALSEQKIPGRLQCEFYDLGGEGVAYHDTDNKNSGSGALNKGPGYYFNFRINEAVDISFTKYHDSIDNSIYSLVKPEIDQLYLGWTEPGEWTRYTVNVLETGDYKIGAMYTSNRGGAVRFVVDEADSTDLLKIPSTFNEKEPIKWRNWHHWNYVDSLGILHLEKGKRVLKLEIAELGNFNFDYFNFEKITSKK
jgi:hypothetical protein